MSTPQAGWYPDPSGDKTKLRYWDGGQWTNDFTDAPNYATADTNPGTEYVEAEVISTVPQPQAYQAASQQPAYQVGSQDSTLRLVAFIFAVVSTAVSAPLLLPLAWCIPMTVHTYGIYKGKKGNSVAFGVCALLFLSIVSGILLLVSKKDK